MWSLFTLFNQCFDPVIPREDAHELQVHQSSFLYSFPVDLIQAFGVDHIPFLVSNVFPCRCTSLSFTASYSFVLECWRYITRLVFPFSIRSRYFEVVISFKSFYLTGTNLSSKQSFYGVSFEWALTHRSFPRILPDSSNFFVVILKFIAKFDVRMFYHQSNVFLQDLSNSFHRWRNLSILHSGVPQ